MATDLETKAAYVASALAELRRARDNHGQIARDAYNEAVTRLRQLIEMGELEAARAEELFAALAFLDHRETAEIDAAIHRLTEWLSELDLAIRKAGIVEDDGDITKVPEVR